MRCIFALLLISAFSLFASEHGDVPRHVLFEADVVYFERDKVNDHCLVQEESSGQCLISTDNVADEFGHNPGLRALMNIMPNLDATWQFAFLGFFRWDRNKGVTSEANLEMPVDANITSDYINADSANVRFLSKLDTGEINYIRHVTPQRINYFSVSWLAGLRFAYVSEYARVRFNKDSRTSNYYAKTWNRLYGFQFGGLFEMNPEDWITFGLRGKFGLMGNFGHQVSVQRDFNNENTIRDHDHGAFNLCWEGEGAFDLTIYIFKRMRLHGSWEVFYLSDVASAMSQFGFSSSGSDIKNNDDILYHGWSVGVGIEF
ncbi:MAG: hypothetical protein ChlgKO_00250 [Chlamydiales bacterium]